VCVCVCVCVPDEILLERELYSGEEVRDALH